MNNQLAIKVWKMDYSFLIKNYLNPEMWNKQWTLFEYKTFKITLNIYAIQTYDEKLLLDVKVHYLDEDSTWNYVEHTVSFSLKVDDVTFLKRQINSAIFNCFVDVEKNKICNTKEYTRLKDMEFDEHYALEDIANKFLDKIEVYNENIREAYIDAFIDESAKIPQMEDDYVESQIYRNLTDLYLVWLNALEDDPKKEIRIKEIKEKLGNDEYENVIEQIKEFKRNFGTEEYEEAMTSNFKEILNG